MSMKLLLWLSVGALLSVALALALIAIGVFGCVAVQGGAGSTCRAIVTGVVFIVTALLLVGVGLHVTAWILGLVATARAERWGWFVAILLLTPVATVVYALTQPNPLQRV